MATRYVDPNASPGGDGTTTALSGANAAFNSLNVWESTRNANISEPEICICRSNGGAADSTQVTITGWTTTSANYIQIEADSAYRHTGTWSTSRYRLTQGSANNTLDINEDYVRVIGLQIEQSSTTWRSAINVNFTAAAGSSNIIIDGCILRTAANHGHAERASTLVCITGTVNVRNCIVYGTNRDNESGLYVAGATVNADNCTLVANGSYGCNRPSSGTVTLRNCYSGGNTDGPYNGTMTRTTCAHDTATVFSGSTASVPFSTATFVSVTSGSENFHLASGSALINAGTDLSGTFTTDIDFQTRSGTWDIGADEVVVTGYTITAEAGSFSITGTAAALKYGRRLNAEAGSVAVTGIAAALKYGRRVSAEAGAYVINGQAATLVITRRLNADAGSVSVTGTSAGLLFGRRLTAAGGSFVITGTDANLVYTPGGGNFILTAEAGSFAISGTAAGLRHGRRVSAEAGSFAITGIVAALRAARRLGLDSGSIVITGTPAAMRYARRFIAEAGAVIITGQDVSFRYGKTLNADAGAYAISGTAARLLLHRVMSALPGAFVITGAAAGLNWSGAIIIEAEPDVIILVPLGVSSVVIPSGVTEIVV